MIRLLTYLLLFAAVATPRWAPAAYDPKNPLKRRVASVFISKAFINEQLKARTAKAPIFKDFKIELDAKTDQMFLLGKIQVPLEEMGTMNLEPGLGEFKFRVTLKLSVTKDGHLVLEFPIKETYFYPAISTDPKNDRVIVPVELLSLGLASARGYLAALSGDMSIYDRKTAKLKSELKTIQREIKAEEEPEKIEDLKLKKKLVDLQLQAVPIERARMENTAKSVNNILAFTGEKELNINEEISARKNAIILKLRLSKLLPYLKDIELGGVRISHDKVDGGGEDYFVVDVDSQLEEVPSASPRGPRQQRVGLKVAPSLLIRLNQNIFNSKALMSIQKDKMNDIRDFEMALKDDGLHVSGKWKKYFISVPFDTTVDFVTTGPDVFEIRLRELNIKGFDFKFLTKFALDAVKDRLDAALSGICTFEYLGKDKDESQVLKVTVEPKKLVPAYPDLHLVAVDVGNRQFMLKIGHIE
ncbi:hypothetical protein [Bdellovibrio sp. HCB337]|uniref:hypothetical protein n=1 Tax=Bdellovibrio sp. HCB337 TaxID=3394358 RepID=UPI0039A46E14